MEEERKTLLEYFKGDELAAGVWEGKYKQEGEVTPDDMHRRLAKEFGRIEHKYVSKELFGSYGKKPIDENLSNYGKTRENLNEDDIYNLFKDFKYIIPQGSIMSQLGSKSIGSLSNCFVVGQPEDSYGGIMLKDEQLVQLMKRRGGVGIDISTLRPKGTETTNAAKTSTGAVSFMHRFSNTTREVAQNGRRGALMISIDINHPDVMDFIKIKRDLSQVTGANISIKLNDVFMESVERDEDYLLTFPCNWSGMECQELNNILTDGEYNKLYTVQGKKTLLKDCPVDTIYVKRVKAKEYWDEIIKSAHNVAEPGLMFWDAMVDYSPDGAYEQFRQVTTNPCSEIGMQPYDACRLIAVNLYSFVKDPFTSKAEFDSKKFYEVNYEAMRLSDDLIDLEIEHINRILDKISKDPETGEARDRERLLWEKVLSTAQASRRTGLGFTALGDTLAALGMKYDSDEALLFIEQMMHVKMESELDCTIDLAVLRGTFEGWDDTKEYHVHTEDGMNEFYKFIGDNFNDQAIRMGKYGRRNVSWSTVAPTGTVSLLAQTTSGIEPLFMGYYMRRKKVNPNDKDARVDFTDQNGDTWQEFPVLHPKFKEWMIANIKPGTTHVEEEFNKLTKEDLQRSFEVSPWYGSTANDIDWIKRVEIQSIIQKYITHSISSTINLPEDVSEEEVSKIYLESWKKGLKGITVYRDGSRSGVLVDVNKSREEFDYIDATKRPKELEAEVHLTKVGGVSYNVFIGLLNNKPYEVFIETGSLNNSKGKIQKAKKGQYNYCVDDLCVPISSTMTDEQAAITRLVSTSLRHGADIKFIVEQLQKTPGDIFSFTKGLARVLKKYIPDGAKSTVKCQDCGSENVVFENGCNMCRDCGGGSCS